MRVVPVCSGLIKYIELIFKRASWRDRTLSDPDRAISPCCSSLKDAVPMLGRISNDGLVNIT